MSRASKEIGLECDRMVWAFHKQGWTHKRIAEKVGLSRSTVSRILRRLRQVAVGEPFDVAAVKARQTRQLEWIADEALQEWERSKRDLVTQKTVQQEAEAKGKTSAGPPVKTEITRKKQTGMPSYLAQARGALADIRKIWSIDATDSATPQTDVSDPRVSEAAIAAALAAQSNLKNK